MGVGLWATSTAPALQTSMPQWSHEIGCICFPVLVWTMGFSKIVRRPFAESAQNRPNFCTLYGPWLCAAITTEMSVAGLVVCRFGCLSSTTGFGKRSPFTTWRTQSCQSLEFLRFRSPAAVPRFGNGLVASPSCSLRLLVKRGGRQRQLPQQQR